MSDSDRPIFTRGAAALGALVIRARRDPKTRKRIVCWMKKSGWVRIDPDAINQDQFAQWVTAMTGIRVTEAAIGRVERGEGLTGPPINVLIALCHRLKLLKLPNGSRCDMNRAVDILCGEVELDEEWLQSVWK